MLWAISNDALQSEIPSSNIELANMEIGFDLAQAE